MRIIAGSLKGRQFDSPPGNRTHPMSDKVRGAIFNALGDIEGLTVLDVFAGTGALSFEAVSRGAASAVAIDSDRNAQLTLLRNVNSLGMEKQVKIIKASVSAWSETSQGSQYDLVFCDPPYDDLQLNVINKLVDHVKDGGLLVCSLPPNVELDLPTNLRSVTQKSYGDATLVFYRRIS